MRQQRPPTALVAAMLMLASACAARAPRPLAPDLVDITTVDPTIRLDLRYATRDNFTGVALYPAARCLLRRDAAERLARVQRRLQADGFGLLVWDCYRPLAVQERFWALVPDERYVARPQRQNGRPLAMPSGFDDFSERAHRDAANVKPAARANAARLESAMTAEGFQPLPSEWWHFDAPGWQGYELLDVPLEP